ncbi:MAG: RNA polymerase sigma-70 factor, partial [Bacillota bacterium]
MDERLIARCVEGDQQAFALLVSQYQTQVYNLAWRYLGEAEDAKDATQEAFIKVYHALPKYQGQAKFSTWLYRIVANTCIDYLRRRRPQFSLDAPRSDEDEGSWEIASDEPSLEQQVERQELRIMVQHQVESLPPKYRMVVTLYHLQGMSYQEISQVLDLPVRTVETQLYRAKAMLRERL